MRIHARRHRTEHWSALTYLFQQIITALWAGGLIRMAMVGNLDLEMDQLGTFGYRFRNSGEDTRTEVCTTTSDQIFFNQEKRSNCRSGNGLNPDYCILSDSYHLPDVLTHICRTSSQLEVWNLKSNYIEIGERIRISSRSPDPTHPIRPRR
jgi:hypothetical protein